jgi:hypothetical protein
MDMDDRDESGGIKKNVYHLNPLHRLLLTKDEAAAEVKAASGRAVLSSDVIARWHSVTPCCVQFSGAILFSVF